MTKVERRVGITRRAPKRGTVFMAELRPKTATKTSAQRDACLLFGNKGALRYRCVSFNLPPSFAFEHFEGGHGRTAFGGLFAFAGAAGELLARVKDGALKNAVVIRARHGGRLVARRVGRAGLEFFLQLTLGIVNVGYARELAEG